MSEVSPQKIILPEIRATLLSNSYLQCESMKTEKHNQHKAMYEMTTRMSGAKIANTSVLGAISIPLTYYGSNGSQ